MPICGYLKRGQMNIVKIILILETTLYTLFLWKLNIYELLYFSLIMNFWKTFETKHKQTKITDKEIVESLASVGYLLTKPRGTYRNLTSDRALFTLSLSNPSPFRFPIYSKWFTCNKDSESPFLLSRWHRVPSAGKGLNRGSFRTTEFFWPCLVFAWPCLDFCPQKPRVQLSHECACNVVNAREVTRDFNPMGSLHWLADSSQGIFIPRDSSLFFSVSVNHKIARYSIVTVMLRSISMSL